jgi:hypothetical protein
LPNRRKRRCKLNGPGRSGGRLSDEQREAQASIRELIWSLYRDLKAYRRG